LGWGEGGLGGGVGGPEDGEGHLLRGDLGDVCHRRQHKTGNHNIILLLNHPIPTILSNLNRLPFFLQVLRHLIKLKLDLSLFGIYLVDQQRNMLILWTIHVRVVVVLPQSDDQLGDVGYELVEVLDLEFGVGVGFVAEGKEKKVCW
jgi:hypothetical protein